MAIEGSRFVIDPKDVISSAERTSEVIGDLDLFAVSIRERLKVIKDKNRELMATWGHFSKNLEPRSAVNFFGALILTYDMLPADLQELEMFEGDKKFLDKMEELHTRNDDGNYEANVQWFFDELPKEAEPLTCTILDFALEIEPDAKDDFLIGAAYDVAPAFLVLQGRSLNPNI